jgi:predicted dehydrogenase
MLKVGIVGIGFMGMIHYHAYQRMRGVRVAAIAERDPVRRAGDWRSIKGNFGPPGEQMDLSKVATYVDIDELLLDADVDMIDICLPTAAHAPMTIKVLQAGKHVFCEKPIALKTADAQSMVAAAEKAGRMLMIGHVLPFFPEYRFAYQAITGGKYGRLLGGHFKRIISDPLWVKNFYDPQVVGGPMLDLHVHDAHFIRLTCGMPRAVQCVGTMRGNVVERFSGQWLFDPPSQANGGPANDGLVKGGFNVTVSSGVINQQGRSFTHGYEIYLESATLLYDFSVIDGQPLLSMPVTVLLKNGKVLQPKLGEGDAITPFENELTEAAKAIKSGTQSPLLQAGLARDAVVLCQKQTQSVVSGKTVKI